MIGIFDSGSGGLSVAREIVKILPREKYVFFAAVGKTVKKGKIKNMKVRDIPAIVTRALGVPGSPSWDSAVPADLFED